MLKKYQIDLHPAPQPNKFAFNKKVKDQHAL